MSAGCVLFLTSALVKVWRMPVRLITATIDSNCETNYIMRLILSARIIIAFS